MSENASQTQESTDSERGGGCRSAADGRVCGVARGTAPPVATLGSGGPVRGLAAYYRLRCIALETAAVTLERELQRERRRFDEVVERYEAILQEHGADGSVTASRRR